MKDEGAGAMGQYSVRPLLVPCTECMVGVLQGAAELMPLTTITCRKGAWDDVDMAAPLPGVVTADTGSVREPLTVEI